MPKPWKRLIILSFCFPFLGACQKGIPNISDLQTLSGFSLDQKSISVSNKLTPSFQISGRCKSYFQDIQITLDGGQKWSSLSLVAPGSTVDCSGTGTFSAQISLSNTPLEISKWSGAGSYNLISLRALSDLGQSDVLTLELLHSTGGGLASLTPASSNSPLTGGNYKISGSASAFVSAPTLSGGNYKLQGEVLW